MKVVRFLARKRFDGSQEPPPTNSNDLPKVDVQPRPRPYRVTLLAVGGLTIASLNLIRLIEAVRQWKFLSGLPNVAPLYLALSGLIWAAIGIPLFWGLLQGIPWTRRYAKVFVVVYALYYWLDRLLVADRNVITAKWHFMVGLTAFLLLFSFWALVSQKSQAFFRDQPLAVSGQQKTDL
jgi:hypothetical protein